MHKQVKYSFQERNEDFPEVHHERRDKEIGKILSKYSRIQQVDTEYKNYQRSRVRNGIGINYLQIYKDIHISQNSNNQREISSTVQLPRNIIYHNNAQNSLIYSTQNYQSAFELPRKPYEFSNEYNVEKKQSPQNVLSSQVQVQQHEFENHQKLAQNEQRQQKIVVYFQEDQLKQIQQQFQGDNNLQQQHIPLENKSINKSINKSQLSYHHNQSKDTLHKLNQELKNSDINSIQKENQKSKYEHTHQEYSGIYHEDLQHDLKIDQKQQQQQEVQQQQFHQNPQKHQNLPLYKTLNRQQQYTRPFNLQLYTQIYPILKSMQTAMKSSLIDTQSLVRGVKQYLEIIASGCLDNIDQFDLQLHKKKIVKTALLYQRVAIIVIAFAYANHSLKDSHKYLINLLSYALGSSLMLVQVLKHTQISQKNDGIKKSDRLILKKSMDTIRNNNDVLIDSIYKLSKYDNLFYQNLKQIVKLLHKSSLEQTFYNILEYFAFFLCVSDLYHMLPFLAVAPDPYLAPSLTHRYTLVLDIVEVCCLGTKKARNQTFRPYAQHFLEQMSQYYEIVAFTNSLPNQIDKLSKLLDPKGHIKHFLYKHHGIHKQSTWIKELDRLGRDLNRVILLDNQHSAGQASKNNCIHIPQWRGTKNDTVLAQLCPVLAMIAIKKMDTMVAVQKIRQQTHKNQQQGLKYVNFGINFE